MLSHKNDQYINAKHKGWLALAMASLVVLLAQGSAEARVALPEFTEIVQAAAPAVVNISTTQKIKHKRQVIPHGQMPDLPDGTPFDDFLRKYFEGEGGGEFEEYNGSSLGSGFIISADGYVLTNHHVIKDADEIIVRLSDRRELVAKVIGSDPRSDVALIKIEAKDLPVVKLGRSADLKVGEWVLAIGSPFDFDHSVTAGIVSALGRSLPNENYVPFIQTDVAINPGNSGGPLFNLDGEVVGINAQIFSRTGGFMGLSFAIPIDLAGDVVEQLKKNGHVSRGWLGILIQNITRDLAESFGMTKPEGALVSQVLPDSPALKAGFKTGDVVLEFDGKPVTDSASLPPMVGRTKVGSSVPVKVMRDGKPLMLNVVIGELPDEEELKVAGSERGDSAGEKRLGAVVSDLTAEQKDTLEPGKTGVFVQQVTGGPARNAGLRSGDIILMVNHVSVKNVAHLSKLIDGLPKGKSVPMLVQRQGGPTFLALKLPEKSD